MAPGGDSSAVSTGFRTGLEPSHSRAQGLEQWLRYQESRFTCSGNFQLPLDGAPHRRCTSEAAHGTRPRPEDVAFSAFRLPCWTFVRRADSLAQGARIVLV